MKTYFSIIILLILLNLDTAYSQKRYLFHNYTTKDGLINNTIFAINQDKQGYIWFGTDAGVSRFNGYNFNNRVIPAICDNEAYSQYIEKDSKGRLVFASFMQGIHVEQSNGSYKQFLIVKKSIGKNVVRAIKACPDGKLLVSTSRQLYIFKNDSFKRLFDCGLNRNAVNTIEYDQQNNIWFGGFYGLGVILSNDTSKTPYYIPELKDIFVVKILFDRQHHLLVGTKQGYYQISFKNTINIKSEYTISQPIPELKSLNINHIYIDHHFNVWLSTSTAGVFKVFNNNVLERISYENGLPSASVMCVYEDYENTYWFGTPDGVSKLLSFTNYSYSFDGKPLSGIGVISRDRFNRLYLWDGTNLFLVKDEKVSKINLKGTHFEEEGIKSFYFADDDVYIINSLGLYKMPLTENLNFNKARLLVDFMKEEVSGFMCYMVDNNGIVWLGFEKGLYALKHNKLVACKVISKKELNLRPVQIVKDRYGYYWIGDFSYGLYRMKLDNTHKEEIILDSVKVYQSLKPDSAFVTAWVQDMLLDHEGNLWMSSLYSGVYKLKINHDGVVDAHLYSSRNGLSSNNVTQILEDKNNNIWFATQNGADRLVPQKGGRELFVHYNNKNGLGINVYDLLPATGLCYISYAEGFFAVDTRQYAIVPKAPPRVIISSVSVMGKADSVALQSRMPYKLRYNQNFIAFEFAAISFNHEDGLVYQYELQGLDKTWSAYSDRRFVNYNSLLPGKYIFKVRAKALNGLENKNITELSFIITLPFYRTYWFIVSCILILITIIYIVYQYRLRQHLKLERLRTRIASDLHDDVGSTLSSISILSEILQSQMDNNPKSTEMIRKIGYNARNMLESMDDIIWAVNPKNDRFQNLGLRIREFAIPLFESKNINFSILFSEQLSLLPIPMDVRRNVYLIAKESVNNLVKYANCSDAKIEFKENHTELLMKITDNGIGFDPENTTSRNGLRNMKRRAEQIKAKLTISSNPGEGSIISLTFKII